MHRRTTLLLAGAATLAALTTPALAAGHAQANARPAHANAAATKPAKPAHVKTVVVGTLVSVSGTDLLVTTNRGTSTTVATTGSTVFTRDDQAVTLADLQAGDHVAIKLAGGTAVRVNASSPDTETVPTEAPEPTEAPTA